jgi:hypothetical protein
MGLRVATRREATVSSSAGILAADVADGNLKMYPMEAIIERAARSDGKDKCVHMQSHKIGVQQKISHGD